MDVIIKHRKYPKTSDFRKNIVRESPSIIQISWKRLPKGNHGNKTCIHTYYVIASLSGGSATGFDCVHTHSVKSISKWKSLRPIIDIDI
jgi:hypothetical protein